MKLDTKAIRYLTADDWRVLTAVEQGSRNHVLVPTPLIAQIASLRSIASVHKSISALAKVGLIAKQKNAKYDGYRLTYGGLDYLALNALRKGKHVYSVGNQIGVGKESDIYVVADEQGNNRVLKIHRLGRISFRTVKANRDYLRNRASGSWMYMSRLAAMKEFAFMRALRENGFRVPEPVAQSRHTVVMEFVDAFPLRQISEVAHPAKLYAELMEMVVSLAHVGLIHGDFNEFNILIKEEGKAESAGYKQMEDDARDVHLDSGEPRSNTEKGSSLIPVLIDFPQMLSVDHTNAAEYFDRDVSCVKRFFSRRFGFTSDEPGPFFADVVKDIGKAGKRLDVQVEATGFSKRMAKELEGYMKEVGAVGDAEVAGQERGEVRENVDDEGDEIEDDEALREDKLSGDEVEPVPERQFEPLRDDLEIGLDRLDLSSTGHNNLEGLRQLDHPAKPAHDFRATKKAAGWAI
ncbi:MAG: hypothetical protein M1820_001209 [Bogoriella megaspora]|nr:MAG: hypothetical protein M1820_001209 [Bogoriella megaspora]